MKKQEMVLQALPQKDLTTVVTAYSTFKPVSHNGNSKNFLTFIFVMVITVTSFLGTNSLFAYYGVPTQAPECMQDECPGAEWYYAQDYEVATGWFGQTGDNCVAYVDFKWAHACGKCYVNILAYRYNESLCGSRYYVFEALVTAILIDLPEKACRLTNNQTCISNIRISSSNCARIYEYNNVIGGEYGAIRYVPYSYDPNSVDNTYTRYVPIKPGEVVRVPCSNICCKATVTLCRHTDNDGNISYSIAYSDVSAPPCLYADDNIPHYQPCQEDCNYSTFYGRTKPTDVNNQKK